MPRKRSPQAQLLFELDQNLTAELQARLPSVLKGASRIQGRELDLHAFHGIIGGKNNELVDAIRTQFADPKDFLGRWCAGLIATAGPDIKKGYDNGATRLVALMKDDRVREYTCKFLTRNFYRNFTAGRFFVGYTAKAAAADQSRASRQEDFGGAHSLATLLSRAVLARHTPPDGHV